MYGAGLEKMSALSGTESNNCLKFKLVLLGDIGVGKTSIFMRIRDNTFCSDRASSIGIDTCIRRLTVDNKDIQVSENKACRLGCL